MSAKDSYLQKISEGLKYNAAWMPNQSLSLGQVGKFKSGEFEPWTSLQELKLPFVTTQGKTAFALDYDFKTSLRLLTKASLEEKVKGSKQNTGAKIEFKQKGAFLFQAKNCREDVIANRSELEQEILGSYMQGVWKSEWVVIDLLVTAESTTILISDEEKTSIELNANQRLSISKAFLAEQSFGFTLSDSSSGMIKFITESSLTPLYRISRLHKRFWIAGDRELQRMKGNHPERDILEEVTPENAA